jgi:hypothetical protein
MGIILDTLNVNMNIKQLLLLELKFFKVIVSEALHESITVRQ